MRFDQYGLLVSEIYFSGHPGNLGDSCASTARYVHLRQIVEELTFKEQMSLERFFTNTGTMRHPDSIWPQSDQSSDQDLPLYIALNAIKWEFWATSLFHQIVGNKYRTGNGQLISPAFYAILTNKKWLLNIALVAQLALFALPLRWDDGKKKFESTKGSSCDWLNFAHCLFIASPWVRRLIKARTVLEKICDYYNNEPNVDWLLELYAKAIERAYA